MLVGILLIGTILSIGFVARYAHHDCRGVECPICIEIEKSIEFISSIQYLPIASVSLGILYLVYKVHRVRLKIRVLLTTLVSLKVEMLD